MTAYDRSLIESEPEWLCSLCGDPVEVDGYDCTEDPTTGELMHRGCAEMAIDERAEALLREEMVG